MSGQQQSGSEKVGSLALGATVVAVSAALAAGACTGEEFCSQNRNCGDEASADAGGDAGAKTESDAGADAASSGPEASVDPCAACAPEATCLGAAAPDGGSPCQCPQGYDGDGTTCTRNPCQPLAGEPAPCPGAQTSCTVVAGAASCECNTGYASCDGTSDPSPGCETQTATNSLNCGRCGLICAGALACTNGACAQPTLAVSAGGAFTFAVMPSASPTTGGNVAGWGYYDGLANASWPTSTAQVTTPTAVVGVGVVSAVDAGSMHACAIPQAGDKVSCWGTAAGAVVLGTTGSVATGIVVSHDIAGVTQVAAAGSSTCAATALGSVLCWGWNNYGELGFDPSTLTYSIAPTAVPGIQDATRIGGGGYAYCAVDQTGHVSCWGYEFGYAPVPLPDETGQAVTDAVDVRVGTVGSSQPNHLCVLRAGGTLWCLGDNQYGQLGRGTVGSTRVSKLAQVAQLVDVEEFSLGEQWSMARTKNGDVYVWGNTANGRLGLGQGAGQSLNGLQVVTLPTLLADASPAAQVDAGYGHGCARLLSGQVKCWGDNSYGQIGNGTASQPATSTTAAVDATAWTPANVKTLP